MKKSTRIISILLAMVIGVSCVSIGVSAQYADYSQPAGYDSLEHPYVSISQCGSMLLDFIDEILAEQDIHGEIDAKLWSPVEYDLRSIDKTFDSLIGIMNSGLFNDASGLLDLGDLENINISAIRRAPRRTTVGRTDLEMVYALVDFLRDNANLIGRIIDSCWDNGGLVASFLDINETVGDVHQLLRDTLYDALYGDYTTPPCTNTSNADDMVDIYLYDMLTGNEAEGIIGILPGVSSLFSAPLSATGTPFKLSTLNFYTTIRRLIDVIIDQYAKDALYETFADMDESVTSFIYQFLEVPEGTTTNAFVDELLNLETGYLTKFLIINDTGIYLQPDFFSLLSQLIGAARGLLSSLNFYPNIEQLSSDEVNAIENESSLVAYLARTALVGLDLGDSLPKYFDIPVNVTSLREVATYILINVMADKMPEIDYYAMIQAGTLDPAGDGVLDIAADYAYYYLNANTTMNIPSGLNFDQTIEWMFNWLISQFGGVIKTSNLTYTDVWKNIDTLLWQNVFSLSWLGPEFQAISLGNQTKTLIFDKLIYAILDWDFNDLFSIFRVNTAGELNQPFTTIVLNILKRLANGLLEGNVLIGDSITCLNDLLADKSSTSDSNKTNLRVIAENLCRNLSTYDEAILTAVLPLFAKSLAKVDDSAYDIFAPEGTSFTDDDLESMLDRQDPLDQSAIDYTSSEYVFFNSEDFRPLYKYYNYDDIRKDAEKLLKNYRVENTTVTDTEITDITYRLDYYYNRLTLRPADASQLNREMGIASAAYGVGEYGVVSGTKGSSSQYTLRSWTLYMAAYNYAASVYEEYLLNYNNTLRQSKVSLARELLIEAIKGLKLSSGVANYGELDRYILLAQNVLAKAAADPGLYDASTIADLSVQFALAQSVDRGYDGDDQGIIDEACIALSNAYDMLSFNPQLAKVDTAPTVLNKSENLIWGIKEGVSNYITYLQVLGAGIMEITPTSNGKGTGTVIKLMIGEEEIDRYTVIIYGDVDGDSRADGTDAILIYAYLHDLLLAEDFTSVQLMACDSNNDGVTDVNDYYQLVQSGLLKVTINQRGA